MYVLNCYGIQVQQNNVRYVTIYNQLYINILDIIYVSLKHDNLFTKMNTCMFIYTFLFFI